MWQQFLVVWFVACAAAIGYTYAGYPLLIAIAARTRRPRSPDKASEIPHATLLIAAHNEQAVIEERIQNALAMEYPRDRLDIVVASDGSTDDTVAIVQRHAGNGVRLVEFKERQGKANVLNAVIPTLSSEIVLMSDANTFYEKHAGLRMAQWFADPGIGTVCGRLILVDSKTGTNVDGLYWRYETFLKNCEGRLDALLGANGAVYAIRKSMYCRIPIGTLVDDFVIPLFSKINGGGRIVYEPNAIAHEETPPTVRAEFRRRSRIGAGGYQSLSFLWPILRPRYGWTAFSFFSHKLLRWMCPFFLIGLFVANILLLDQPLFRWCFVAQIAFYLLSFAAAYLPSQPRIFKPLRLATMFTSMNAALLVGFIQFAFRRQNGTWIRTVRVAEIGASSRPLSATPHDGT